MKSCALICKLKSTSPPLFVKLTFHFLDTTQNIHIKTHIILPVLSLFNCVVFLCSMMTNIVQFILSTLLICCTCKNRKFIPTVVIILSRLWFYICIDIFNHHRQRNRRCHFWHCCRHNYGPRLSSPVLLLSLVLLLIPGGVPKHLWALKSKSPWSFTRG